MLLSISILIAIAAFTYSEILTPPGEILGGLYAWLEARLPEWLFKPLIGCAKCVAGQWSMWVYLIFFVKYNPAVHAWFVLQSVFNAAVIRGLYYKIIS